jgi:hypothetical protein
MRVSNAKRRSQKQRAALLEALEDRQLLSTYYVNPGQSIQAFINQAQAANDQHAVIQILGGTYQGPSSPITLNGLTIEPQYEQAVTIVPNTTVSNNAVFDVQATGFTLAGTNGVGSSLTINGSGTALHAGVLIEPSVTNVQGATLANVNVTNIHDSNPGFNEGFGVRVTSGLATITGGQIDNYQRAGIEVGPALDDSTGNPLTSQTPTAVIQSVKIYGPHSTTLYGINTTIPTTPSPNAVENGIIFIDGGGGIANGNTVEGNRDSSGNSIGIGAFDAKSGVNISSNIVNDNDAGIVIDALDATESTPAHGGSKSAVLTSDVVTGTAQDADYVENGGQDGIDLFDGITGTVLTTDTVSQNADFGLRIDNFGMVANTTGGNTIQGGNYSKNGIHPTTIGYSANVYDGSTGTAAKTYGTANTYKTSASSPLVFFASGQFNDIVGNGLHFGFWAGAPATLATNTASPTTNANNANFNSYNYFYVAIGDAP